MNVLLRALIALLVPVLWVRLAAEEAGLLYSLISPPAAAERGQTLSLELAVLNPSAVAQTPELPETLDGEIVGPQGRWPVRLAAGEAAASTPRAPIAPGAFALRRYSVAVPSTAPVGAALLELRWPGTRPLSTRLEIGEAADAPRAIAAGPAPTPSPATATTPAPATTERPTTNLVQARPAADALRRTFADRLAPHESIYFIYGADAPAAKFQFSFKYKLLDFKDVVPQRMERSLRFAFTQRSLWDLKAESSPFYDTSYMPELLYESLAPSRPDDGGWFTWLGFQGAFKHESNGRDGPVSRSLNLVYARTVFAFGQLEGWHLLVIPELFGYVSVREENRDLRDYRDYGRLHLVFGRNDGPSLMGVFWAGRDFKHPSVHLDLTIPVRTRRLNFATYLLVQYFNGYGESLLSYQEETETARFGFSLVR